MFPVFCSDAGAMADPDTELRKLSNDMVQEVADELDMEIAHQKGHVSPQPKGLADPDTEVRKLLNDMVQEVADELEMEIALQKGHVSPQPKGQADPDTEVRKLSNGHDRHCRFEELLFNAIGEALIHLNDDKDKTRRDLLHVKQHITVALEEIRDKLSSLE